MPPSNPPRLIRWVQQVMPSHNKHSKQSNTPIHQSNSLTQKTQESHQEEEQGSQGDRVHFTERNCDEFERKYSNSERNCSKGSLQNLHNGANGDSQGVGNPSCSSQEEAKSPKNETQELREADLNKQSQPERTYSRETVMATEQTEQKSSSGGKGQSGHSVRKEALTRGLQITARNAERIQAHN